MSRKCGWVCTSLLCLMASGCSLATTRELIMPSRCTSTRVAAIIGSAAPITPAEALYLDRCGIKRGLASSWRPA
jgi:hypothetical protein